MFQDAFDKLELEEIAIILDRVNSEIEGVDFDPVNTVIMAVDMPFYPGYRFLDIADHTNSPPTQRFVLLSDERFSVLNFSNEPIYALNRELPIKLSKDPVLDYMRFFFAYVRGRHGRFLVVEYVDDIAWKDDPPPPARKAIGKMLKPLKLTNKDGEPFQTETTMVFKDSLFSATITATPEGMVSLTDEELLIEDMPVLDDVFGQ